MDYRLKCRGFMFAAAGILFAVFSSVRLFGQSDTVLVQDFFDAGEGTLNDAVAAKIGAGILSNTVFRLKPYGLYVLTATITVPAGQRLTIIAPEPSSTQETAPPMICWSDSAYTPLDPENSIDTRFNFRCFGDIYLKNVWLLYATTDRVGLGTQVYSSLQIDEDTADHVNRGVFEGVIFDYSAIPANGSGAVGVTASHARLKFENCYFRNCIDTHFRYYGRAVSFPFNTYGWHIDSLSFENCTFANIGYVYMQEYENYADFVLFNHCTFLNTMMFTLESGWWYWLSVTNSIFVNAFMYGDQPGLRSTYDPYPNGGTIEIDSVSAFGFAAPFTDADRHILFTNSSYFIEPWLRDWMAQHVPLGDTTDPVYWSRAVPQPMMNARTLMFFDTTVNGEKVFPYMNRAGIYDSTDPGFFFPPTNQTAIKKFLYIKWYTSEDTNWAFSPTSDINQTWPMNEDLSYSNPTLLTAGMGQFPLGDLYHWFPDEYTQWKAQAAAENARIDAWLTTGIDLGPVSVSEPVGSNIPAGFALSQNYPNPFNPATRITYSIPRNGHISFKVFNLLGEEVASLFEGIQEAGTHIAVFDATGLPSGMYLCRLNAGGFVEAKKMIILR